MIRGAGDRIRGAPVLAFFLVLLEGWHPLSAQSVGATDSSPQDPAVQAASLFSSEPSSTEGGLTLLLPVGAKSISMGRAMTAQMGPEAVFWNPAGIAELTDGQFTVFRGSHLAGEATAFSLLLTRQPLGALGISYQLLDLGDQDLRDREGNVLGTVSFRDHLAILSFATEALPRVSLGLNFKVFQSSVSCRGQCSDAGVSGRTFAIDGGLQFTPVDALPLRLATMVAHAGPDLQLINSAQADPLPTRVRVAAAYQVLTHVPDVADVEFWITAEFEDRWQDLGSPVLYLGGEVVAGRDDLFFLRAGYGQGQSGQPAGLAAGLGVHYQRFHLAVAKSLSGGSISGEAEPVHVTFGVSF